MLAELLQHPFMSARALRENSADAMIDAMLDFELALLSSQEALDACPAGTTDAVTRYLRQPGIFDPAAIASGVGSGGNPAIPFVKIARSALPANLKPYWHQGATSQDLVDSALMLMIKKRLAAADALLAQCRSAAIQLATDHRSTVMMGRTLMQQALPTTFGVRVVQWAIGLEQARRRLLEIYRDGLPVQFGGAVGVHSGWGESGLQLMADIAARLGLKAPILPWHTNRQPVHALATALDAAASAAEKMCLDIAMLCQTEIGELSEPPGEGMGESSSMPHKRNPVRCALVRSSCLQLHGRTTVIINAMAQPLERSLGEWHSEWGALCDSTQFLEGALEQSLTLLSGLEVHQERMKQNLAITGGAIMAEPVVRVLSSILGPEEARRISADAAERARQTQTAYLDILAEIEEIQDRPEDIQQLVKATDPASYTGSSGHQIDAAIGWLTAEP